MVNFLQEMENAQSKFITRIQTQLKQVADILKKEEPKASWRPILMDTTWRMRVLPIMSKLSH
jgi:hypothetical protein